MLSPTWEMQPMESAPINNSMAVSFSPEFETCLHRGSRAGSSYLHRAANVGNLCHKHVRKELHILLNVKGQFAS